MFPLPENNQDVTNVDYLPITAAQSGQIPPRTRGYATKCSPCGCFVSRRKSVPPPRLQNKVTTPASSGCRTDTAIAFTVVDPIERSLVVIRHLTEIPITVMLEAKARIARHLF